MIENLKEIREYTTIKKFGKLEPLYVYLGMAWIKVLHPSLKYAKQCKIN